MTVSTVVNLLFTLATGEHYCKGTIINTLKSLGFRSFVHWNKRITIIYGGGEEGEREGEGRGEIDRQILMC